MQIGFATFGLPPEAVAFVTGAVHQHIEVLSTTAEVRNFVAKHADAAAILIIHPPSVVAEDELLLELSDVIHHGWFRVLLWLSACDREAIDVWPTGLRRHAIFIDAENLVSAEHLHIVKAQLESEILETTASRLFLSYENSYAADLRLTDGLTEFLSRFRETVGASLISSYLLDGDGTLLVLDKHVGGQMPQHLPWKWFEEQFTFRHVCRNYRLSSLQTAELATLSDQDTSWSSAIVSTFRLDDTPVSLLFVFTEPDSDAELTFKICAIAAREAFHLYRARDIAATLDAVQQLSDLPRAKNERNTVLWAMLGLLKLQFGANGASLLEVTERDHGRITFLKTFVHQGRRDTVTFTDEGGFSHYCVRHHSALIINRTAHVDGGWHGYGYVYDPGVVLAGTGKPVSVRASLPPKTVELEHSLLYYPIIAGGDVVAVLKIAHFANEYSYNIRHLKALRALAVPIGAFLDAVNTVAALKARVEHERVDQKMVDLANALFMYREIALGMFHQVTNHANRIESELVLIESLLDGTHRSAEVAERMTVTRDVAKEAKVLIRKAQQRGVSLAPITERCMLVDDIVRPTLRYIERDHPEIALRHTLTNRDYPVNVDPTYMREGLYNLLNNAVWAVKGSKGTKREIFVAVRMLEGGKDVRLQVEDSGIGMEHEVQVALFTPFMTTKPNGTGLGLYFARQLVMHFGGRLELERSFPGRGSTFVITLPLAGDHDATAH